MVVGQLLSKGAFHVTVIFLPASSVSLLSISGGSGGPEKDILGGN